LRAEREIPQLRIRERENLLRELEAMPLVEE
jgi:hypothetical protein